MDDEAKKVEADQRRQFGLARLPLTEHVMRLGDFELAFGRQNDVDENLEAVGR